MDIRNIPVFAAQPATIIHSFAAREANLNNNFEGLMPEKEQPFWVSAKADFESTYQAAIEYQRSEAAGQKEVYVYVLRAVEKIKPELESSVSASNFIRQLNLADAYQVIGIMKLPSQSKYTEKVPYLFINPKEDVQSKQELNRLVNAIYNDRALKLKITSIPVFAINEKGEIQKNPAREIAKNFVDVYNETFLFETETQPNTPVNQLVNTLLEKLKKMADDINNNADDERLFLESYIANYNELRRTIAFHIRSFSENLQDVEWLKFMEMLDRLHVANFGHLGYESNGPFEAEFNIPKQLDQCWNKFESQEINQNQVEDFFPEFLDTKLKTEVRGKLDGKASCLAFLDKTDFMQLTLSKAVGVQAGFVDLPTDISQDRTAIYILADNFMLTRLKSLTYRITDHFNNLKDLSNVELLPKKLGVIQQVTQRFFETQGHNTVQENHVKLYSDIGSLKLTPINAIGNSKDQNRHQALLAIVLMRNLIEANQLPAGKINYFKDNSDHAFIFYQLQDGSQRSYLLDVNPVENRIFDLKDKSQLEEASRIYKKQEQDALGKLLARFSLPFSDRNSNVQEEKLKPLELKSKTVILFDSEEVINSFCIMSIQENAGFVRSASSCIQKEIKAEDEISTDNYSVLDEFTDKINLTHHLSISRREPKKINITYSDSQDEPIQEYYNPFSIKEMGASLYNFIFDDEATFPPYPIYVQEHPETHVVVIFAKISCFLQALQTFYNNSAGQYPSSPYYAKFEDVLVKMHVNIGLQRLMQMENRQNAGWYFALAVMPNFEFNKREEYEEAITITKATLQVLSNQIKQYMGAKGIHFTNVPKKGSSYYGPRFDNGKYADISESICLATEQAFTVPQMKAFLHQLEAKKLFSPEHVEHLQKVYQAWHKDGSFSQSNKNNQSKAIQLIKSPTLPLGATLFGFKNEKKQDHVKVIGPRKTR